MDMPVPRRRASAPINYGNLGMGLDHLVHGQESQDGPTSYFGEKIGDDDVIEASELIYDGEKKSETPACMSLMMAKKRPRIDRFYG